MKRNLTRAMHPEERERFKAFNRLYDRLEEVKQEYVPGSADRARVERAFNCLMREIMAETETVLCKAAERERARR